MNRALLFVCWLVVLGLAGCGAAHKEAATPGREYAVAIPESPAEPALEVQADEAVGSVQATPPPFPGPPGSEAPPAPSVRALMAPPRNEPRALERRAEAAARPVGGKAPEPAPERRPAVASQMLVYTAHLHLRVQEVTKAIDAVEKLARERGGYLVAREDHRITVRVPSAKLDATLDELVALGEVLHRQVRVEDVTDLYFDLQVRMKNLEVVKQRLEELLARADAVADALAVQRQLERVTSELERLRAKLKLLAELVTFSTVTVVFEPRSTESIGSRVRLPFPWMDHLGLGELLRL